MYRQALEHLHGVRDEAATRALIAQENRRYARRQLIWFRKEPNLIWFDGPGESAATIAAVHVWSPNASGARPLMRPPPNRSRQPNIQDVFLNYVRREKLPVTIRMMDGSELEGRIKNFDRFARGARSRRRRSHDLQARDRRDQDAESRSRTTSPHSLSGVATPFTRAIVIVMDSVGIGELPDAAAYGDGQQHARQHRRRRCRCRCRRCARSVSAASAALGVRCGAARTGDRRRRAARTAAWPKRRPARTRSPATGR